MVRHNLVLVAAIALTALCARAADAEILDRHRRSDDRSLPRAGDRYQRGAGLAVEDLNAKGGVLGQRVQLSVGDDFCDSDQAVALADKLASDGVVFVAGHWCSHASISAAKVYEKAKILLISPSSASAKLTDEGGPNVFSRVRAGRSARGDGRRLPRRSLGGGKGIAILDDGTTWGVGVADGARRRLQERGVTAVVDQTITPDEQECSDVVSRMQTAGVEVLFLGGYHREAGLILRQARDRGTTCSRSPTARWPSRIFR